jgi:hypothetical protein
MVRVRDSLSEWKTLKLERLAKWPSRLQKELKLSFFDRVEDASHCRLW